MDIETIKLAFQVLQFIITGAIGVYVYISNKDKVTNDRIGKMEEDLSGELSGHGERIAKLEEASGRAPTHGDLGDIHDRITAVGESVKFLAGEFIGVKNVLAVIHQHLMSGGGK